MDKTAEQIDRCPFCDCSWVVIHRPINGAHVSVKCKGCNAHGPGHAGITDEEAVAAWNKIPRLAALSARPADSDMVERVKMSGRLVCSSTHCERRQECAAPNECVSTWGRTYNRWLARGADHGDAAYRADKAEARRARTARHAVGALVAEVASAVEDTGLLAGDEARDAARAAIAAMGSADMGKGDSLNSG